MSLWTSRKTEYTMNERMNECMNECSSTDSCRDLFMSFKFYLWNHNINSLFCYFLANNQSKYKINYNVYNINTRQKSNFHQHVPNLCLYLHVNYSFGIKLFNILPPSIKRLTDNIKQFKSAFKIIYTLITSALQMNIIT